MKLYKIDKILFIWIIIVFAAIAWPSPDLPEITEFEYSDKIVHVIIFGIVTFLMNGSLTARGIGQRSSFIISLMGGAAYAGLAEIIQLYVPGRSCSLYDFYAGALGGVIALAVVFIIKSRQETKR
jgi:VanZ family protein